MEKLDRLLEEGFKANQELIYIKYLLEQKRVYEDDLFFLVDLNELQDHLRKAYNLIGEIKKQSRYISVVFFNN